MQNLKKEKLKKISKITFIVFLIFYLGTMAAHALKIEYSWWAPLLLLAGLALSIFAHAKRNYITVILLLVHMSIEWFEWSQKSLSISSGFLNVVHIVMDFVFLWHELSAHIKKKRSAIMIGSFTILLVIFFVGKFFVSGSEDIIRFVEPFVVGGVIGCVGSHLFYHLKKINKKQECC